MRWQTGRKRQLPRVLAQAENRLDRRAVHPCRRAGVPAPAAAPDIRCLRVHVTGHHIRFDAVQRAMHRPQRAMRRAQVGEIFIGEVTAPTRGGLAAGKFGLGHQRPYPGVGILAAVFAYPRRIGLDVAGAGDRVCKRRVQQLDQAGLVVHQMFLHRCQRHALQSRWCRLGQHRPGLRNQIDAGFGVGL